MTVASRCVYDGTEMLVCTHVYMYICIYVCVYVCVNVSKQFLI